MIYIFELVQQYSSYNHIYTDSSEENEKVALAGFSARLVDYAPIFTAEMQATLLALQQILISTKKNLYNSQALTNIKIDNTLIIDVLELYNQLVDINKNIILAWLPIT